MTMICGTDFSDRSREALLVAAAMARRAKEPLSLVHVHDDLYMESLYPEVPDSLFEVARERLHREAEVARKEGAEVREVLLRGLADEALVEHAAREDASLIVVGSLGRRSRPRWHLGSTADRTAQASSVPVLVVRGGKSLEDWIAGSRPLRVLVGIDFSDNSKPPLQWLASVRALGPCDVIAAYVYWPPEEHARLGIHSPMDLVDKQPQVEQLLQRDLRTRIGEIPGEGSLSIRILMSFGRPSEHLLELATQESIDLVVVGTHHRRGIRRFWYGSVSHGLLDLAPMAVAVVPGAH